jgi:hypothetical protein
MASKNGSNKMRKVGRNAVFCKFYKDRNQREKNKVIRLVRHLKTFPSDICASKAVDIARGAIRGY